MSRSRSLRSTSLTSPGEATTGLSYAQRRRLLELLELSGPSWCTVASFDADADAVLEECARLHLEGLVARRIDSRYEPGKRSAHWRKVKYEDWREQHAPLGHGRGARSASPLMVCGWAPTSKRVEPRPGSRGSAR